MSWTIAPSLETLRLQLNDAFPNRSKVSDGGIGDAGHSARSSDHNPNDKRVVCARDFTHDPDGGIDGNWLAKTLVANKDPRIKYLIWNKQICSSKTSPWKWRPYSGVNAHRHHLHISVGPDAKQYNDPRKWDLDISADVDVAKTETPKVSAAESPNGIIAPGETLGADVQKQEAALDPPPFTEGVRPIELKPDPPQAADQTIVDVPPVVSEKPESVASKAMGWYGALPAGVVTFLGGVVSWLQGAATELIVAFFGASAAIGMTWIVTNQWGKQKDRDRENAAAEKQKDRDFELTKLQLQSAMDPNKQTVRIAPPVVVVPDVATPVEAK